jgi:hypothetical protein
MSLITHIWELIMMSNQTKTIIARCPYDGLEFQVNKPESMHKGEFRVSCPYCAATVTIRIDNVEHVLKVEGSNADEVKQVSESLMEKLGQSTASNIVRSPWVSGSFYLATIVILISLFLVVARMVNFVVLPIVIVGGLLAVSLIGAFQLRQDKNLSETNFITLMALTFKQLPFIRRQEKTNNENR